VEDLVNEVIGGIAGAAFDGTLGGREEGDEPVERASRLACGRAGRGRLPTPHIGESTIACQPSPIPHMPEKLVDGGTRRRHLMRLMQGRREALGATALIGVERREENR